jgi:hypothetical protein
MKTLLLLLPALAAMAFADGPGRIVSRYAAADFPLTPDPEAPAWKGIPGVFAENDAMGKPVAGHRTEIRSRWTARNLYFLFICPYEKLNLKPNPELKKETNQLWDWDVAEVFAGADFDHIRRYREYEISPRGEWVDLDIDRDHPLPEGGWLWNSGFANKTRIDEKNKVWYGVMRIPIQSIDSRTPANGVEMRVNFYRCQGGPGPDRKFIAWQPTKSRTFHVPEAFGRLVLEGK